MSSIARCSRGWLAKNSLCCFRACLVSVESSLVSADKSTVRCSERDRNSGKILNPSGRPADLVRKEWILRDNGAYNNRLWLAENICE